MPVSQVAVEWAFRLFLGREIAGLESGKKTVENLCKFQNEQALAEAFVKCDEFRLKNTQGKGFSKYIECIEPHEVRKRTLEGFDPSARIKISAFGNCQVEGIGNVIEACCKGAHVKSYHIGVDANRAKLNGKAFASIINESDLILLQGLDVVNTISKLYTGSEKRIRVIPSITFNGYQPDNDYVTVKNFPIMGGGLGNYISILASYCWNHGVSIENTLEMFRDEVYEHLGYYNYITSSRNGLIRLGQAIDFPMPELLLKWMSKGCFMHSINHPKLFVLADIAYELLRKNSIEHSRGIESYVHDQLADSVCWPVYPEIAARNSIGGSYLFKRVGLPNSLPEMINLEEFVTASFTEYNKYEKGSLQSPRFQEEGFQSLGQFIKQKKISQKSKTNKNPYSGLSESCFWRKSVAAVTPDSLDPVVAPLQGIGREDRVATAGSCFAQHIAKRLSTEGFNYYFPEDGSALQEEERKERHYGVFSCRYGNLYTTRQLVQLFDRSMGRFTPKEGAWQRPDGRYVDPFRPQIEPAGFESEADMLSSRSEHLACVKELFSKLDILVFTLGLTESWESLEDGAVFPLAPGVAGGAMVPSRHRFRNLTAKEVADDLELFLLKLQGVNPKARVILTVSPVPLIATYENRHVLVSNTHSKSVLRTVAGEMVSRYSNCDYFPSYEIITGQHVGNGYLEEDLRSVRPEGVDHVMWVFLKHYAGKAATASKTSSKRESEQRSAIERINDIICDEEIIDKTP